MHAKQQRAGRAADALGLLFLLGSAGCVLLADIGKPSDDSAALPDRGSTPQDASVARSQGGGGPATQTTCYADLAADSHNCGFCGHDCGGTLCTQGLCAETTIFTAGNVRSLAVDNDRVFFATDEDIMSCAPGPQTKCPRLVDSDLVAYELEQRGGGGRNGNGGGLVGVNVNSVLPLDPRGLALYGDRFFVADQTNSVIFACPMGGCSQTTIAFVRPRVTPRFAGGLAVDASSVVWGETNGLGQAASPASGAKTDGDLLTNGSAALGAVARDVTRIELVPTATLHNDILFRGSAGAFTFTPSTTGALSELVQGSAVRDVADDGRFAYVAAPGAILRLERLIKARTTLAQLEAGSEVSNIVADANGVYAVLSSAAHPRIVRVRAGGFDTVAVPSQVVALGLSNEWVYYATKTAIVRVAR